MKKDLREQSRKMNDDFTTAPLAPGLIGAGGGTVEKSISTSHTEIRTLPESIKKWDGKLPMYTGAGPMPFLNVGSK